MSELPRERLPVTHCLVLGTQGAPAGILGVAQRPVDCHHAFRILTGLSEHRLQRSAATRVPTVTPHPQASLPPSSKGPLIGLHDRSARRGLAPSKTHTEAAGSQVRRRLAQSKPARGTPASPPTGKFPRARSLLFQRRPAAAEPRGPPPAPAPGPRFRKTTAGFRAGRQELWDCRSRPHRKPQRFSETLRGSRAFRSRPAAGRATPSSPPSHPVFRRHREEAVLTDTLQTDLLRLGLRVPHAERRPPTARVRRRRRGSSAQARGVLPGHLHLGGGYPGNLPKTPGGPAFLPPTGATDVRGLVPFQARAPETAGVLRHGRRRRRTGRRPRGEGRGAPLELARATVEPRRVGERSARPKGRDERLGRCAPGWCGWSARHLRGPVAAGGRAS